jgi:hypothetical protein
MVTRSANARAGIPAPGTNGRPRSSAWPRANRVSEDDRGARMPITSSAASPTSRSVTRYEARQEAAERTIVAGVPVVPEVSVAQGRSAPASPGRTPAAASRARASGPLSGPRAARHTASGQRTSPTTGMRPAARAARMRVTIVASAPRIGVNRSAGTAPGIGAVMLAGRRASRWAAWRRSGSPWWLVLPPRRGRAVEEWGTPGVGLRECLDDEGRDGGLEQVAGKEGEGGDRGLAEVEAGDEGADRDAERVDDRDAADDRAEQGAPPHDPRAGVGDEAHDPGSGDETDEVAGGRRDEHAGAAASAAEQRQADEHERLEGDDAECPAGRAEHGAGEHDPERLGGHRHGQTGHGDRADEAERGDERGEHGDAGDVTVVEGTVCGHVSQYT